jgi:hypothetical protein
MDFKETNKWHVSEFYKMSTVHSSTLQTWEKMKRGQHKWFTIKYEYTQPFNCLIA